MNTVGKVVIGIVVAVGAFFGIKRLVEAAPGKYVCPFPGCGETFDTYEELQEHFDTAHPGEPIEITWD
jgi:hypothetical protein